MKYTKDYKNRYRKKLNGYRCSHRNKWLLVQEYYLSLQALALLEFYIDIFDFDVKHDSFGLFSVDFEAIASIFNKSQNTIRSWHSQLLKVGLIKATKEKNHCKMLYSKRYIAPGRWQGEASQYSQNEKNQPAEIIFQSIGGKFQKTGQIVQPIKKKNQSLLKDSTSIALGSSKVDSKFSREIHKGNSTYERKILIKQEVRSDEEYQKIYDKGNYEGLIPEDMKWIDQNIVEVREK